LFIAICDVTELWAESSIRGSLLIAICAVSGFWGRKQNSSPPWVAVCFAVAISYFLVIFLHILREFFDEFLGYLGFGYCI
jgi:hypothetical protein